MPVTEYVHVAENALDTAPHTRSAPRAGSPGDRDPAAVPPTCGACEAAEHRYRETGLVVVCVCGRVYAADDWRWPAAAAPQLPALRPTARRIPAPVTPSDEATAATTTPSPTPLERAGARAKALVPDDPELARVRRVLADLRPDCADPLEPPSDESAVPAPPPVTIRDPSASWGGIPRGVGFGAGCALATEVLQARTLRDVLDELDRLAPDARAVLRWLRAHGSLREGLRGLYAEAGLHFAARDQLDAWADLGARREGAPMHGRRLVLAAATAWGR